MSELYRQAQGTRGATCTVLCDPDDGFEDAELAVETVDSWPIPPPLERLGMPPVDLYPDLVQALESYDVIVAADPTLYWNHALFAALAARSNSTRLVVDLSKTFVKPGFGGNLRNRLRRQMTRWIASQTDAFLVATPGAAARYRALGIDTAEGKFVEMGHPVDMDRFHPPEEQRRAEEPYRLLTVGRLVPEKGHSCILEKTAPLLRDGTAHLRIIGEGPTRARLEERAEDLGVETRVDLVGSVAYGEIHGEYQAADIFLGHPLETESWEEYFGATYVEAMASGLPVVATPSGGLPHVLPDGPSAKLVDPVDTEAYRVSIESLLDDDKRRRHLGHQARRYVEETYSLNVLSTRFIDVCEGRLPSS